VKTQHKPTTQTPQYYTKEDQRSKYLHVPHIKQGVNKFIKRSP